MIPCGKHQNRYDTPKLRVFERPDGLIGHDEGAAIFVGDANAHFVEAELLFLSERLDPCCSLRRVLAWIDADGTEVILVEDRERCSGVKDEVEIDNRRGRIIFYLDIGRGLGADSPWAGRRSLLVVDGQFHPLPTRISLAGNVAPQPFKPHRNRPTAHAHHLGLQVGAGGPHGCRVRHQGQNVRFVRKRSLIPQPARSVLLFVPVKTLQAIDAKRFVCGAEVDDLAFPDEGPFIPVLYVTRFIGLDRAGDVDDFFGEARCLEGSFESFNPLRDCICFCRLELIAGGFKEGFALVVVPYG